VGMPRSGTTLLEQMLDRHPQVAGIGESEGIISLGDSLVHAGVWPRGLGTVAPADAATLQENYVSVARTSEVQGKRWLVDKSLHTWRWLPAVAAILPGARCMHIARDPRDTAVSIYLSNFNVRNFAWAGSFEGIRTVMETERATSLEMLAGLGIAHEAIVYEDLVDDPAREAQRCLSRLGLPMDERVLAPEQNTRAAVTLSAMQVRKPINRSSIGRWRNYEFAFDGAWDALAEAHDARRKSR
jgi:hypothetical protein